MTMTIGEEELKEELRDQIFELPLPKKINYYQPPQIP